MIKTTTNCPKIKRPTHPNFTKNLQTTIKAPTQSFHLQPLTKTIQELKLAIVIVRDPYEL